jgi:transketolase
MVGDGELTEGQMWEAALFAAQYRLDNLILLVDYNKVMAKGKLSEMISLDPLERKLESFGFTTVSIDGHDVEDICRAFHRAYYLEMTGKPVAIVAHTVKGRGVRECEYNYKWHTHAPSLTKAREFLSELEDLSPRARALAESVSPFEGDAGVEAVIDL